ncbi:hypothetical protein BV20DRAFT_806083 [Pilatotrama ljubarskyi]|nr:hypothetical protein BV20DRAFT_806083 [Pilatotrama ljubarskyi]
MGSQGLWDSDARFPSPTAQTLIVSSSSTTTVLLLHTLPPVTYPYPCYIYTWMAAPTSGSLPAANAEQASALQALPPFRDASNIPHAPSQSGTSSDVKQTLPRPVLRLLQLAANFNARAAVNKCPVEVLTMIFSGTLDDVQTNLQQLLILTRVCAHWRRVIHGTPSLYQSFAIAHPSLTRAHLDRSLALPLDVVIDQRGRRLGLTSQNLNLIKPHVARLRSLRITLDDVCLSTVLLDYLGETSHRILEHLSVANTRSLERLPLTPWSLVLPSSVGGVLLFLTALCLQDVSLYVQKSLTLGSQFRLKHLELRFTFVAPPTSAQLIRFLSSCPDLEVLILRSEISIMYQKLDDRDPPVVRLHQLRDLVFEGLGYKALDHILRYIRTSAPSLTRFHFEFSLFDRKVANLFLPHSIPEAERRVGRLIYPRALRHLEVRGLANHGVTVLGTYDAYGAESADFSLCVPLYQEGEDEDIDEAEGFCSPTLFWSWPIRDLSQVETLTFTRDCRGPMGLPESEAQWTAILRDLKALSMMHIWKPPAAVLEGLLAALEPKGGPDASMLCPNLRSIAVIDPTGESFAAGELRSVGDDRVRAGGPALSIDMYYA